MSQSQACVNAVEQAKAELKEEHKELKGEHDKLRKEHKELHEEHEELKAELDEMKGDLKEVLRLLNSAEKRKHMVRYVRIEVNNQYLHFAQVEVLSRPEGANVALHKPASQSSVYIHHGQYCAAKWAVDRNSGKRWNINAENNPPITHTNQDALSWWEVDLEEPVDVGEVRIYSSQIQGQPYLTRFATAHLLLLNESRAPVHSFQCTSEEVQNFVI